MFNSKKVVGKILGDRYSRGKEEDDDMGGCPGCGMAYSFFFNRQFHKKGCKYAKEEE